MRLVFMGTPESAVPTLRRCLDDGHEVVAVWTQPDRPAGRGNRPAAPPVKRFARAVRVARGGRLRGRRLRPHPAFAVPERAAARLPERPLLAAAEVPRRGPR